MDEEHYQYKIIEENKIIFQIIDIENNKIKEKSLLKNSIKHIVIAGSSGGHILPAIKYLNELSHHCSREQIIFITNEVGADYLHLIEYEKKNVIQINSQNKTLLSLKLLKKFGKFCFLIKK